MSIELKVLHEAGYPYALEGVRLNFDAKKERMPAVCTALAKRDRGHDKFLRMIIVWFEIRAPRYFLQQLDTYVVAVVKNSQSTMHTILNRPLEQSDFSSDIPDEWLTYLNYLITLGKLDDVKNLLPEGFMQKRIYMMSYAMIKNIIIQRHDHKLPEWREFVKDIRFEVERPELLPEDGK
jgi:hypothetical protein